MDITEIIQRAMDLNNNWKHSTFSTVTENLLSHYEVDLEIDSEKIAVLRLNNNTIGYICLNYPLVFIETKHASQINDILFKFNNIQYITISTLDIQCLTINSDFYNSYFNYMENLNAFSAEDFYFYNVN
ncbi:hypothetical protein [Chryseobacterium sp.]|uniref:hypothetical protein n=1 Tax=Chryseobacterium sp. TaxID=1871047 RepID=UPI00321B33CE